MDVLTKMRIAEAEVSIKTLLVMIYNVIGRTRLCLLPGVVFTTFFLHSLFLKSLWLPTFYALLECNNNCGIISSELVFLPEMKAVIRPYKILAWFCFPGPRWI